MINVGFMYIHVKGGKYMMNYRIVVDSTCDLSKEDAKKYGISIVPLLVNIDGKDYVEGIDITPEQFVEKMLKAEKLPTTSQPSPGAFAEIYEKIKAEGATPITITISQKLSGTYQASIIGAQIAEVPAHSIDSKNGSVPVRDMAIEAAKMAAEGKTFEEISEKVNHMIDNTHIYFGVDTVENLVKGGRLSKTKGKLVSILNLKPIIHVEDGIFVASDKVRGFPAVPKYLFGKIKKTSEVKKITHASVVHTGDSEYVRDLQKQVQELLPDIHVDCVLASAVLTCQVSAGGIAVTYVTE